MEWKRLLIPTYVLPLLWLAATVLAVVTFFAEKQNPDYALPYTLSLAAATAFLGAGIALWVYSFINRQAQDRQFRHEIEVRWFENIYAPLYEDTKQAVQAVEEYRQPWLSKWSEIRVSRFGPFVDEHIMEVLDRAASEFQQYVDLWNAGHSAGELIIDGILKPAPQLSEFANAIHNNLTTYLSGDHRFLFDPETQQPSGYADHQFQQSLESLFRQPGVRATFPTSQEIQEWLRSVKTALNSDKAVQAVSGRQKQVLLSAKGAHAEVLVRMQHPFR